MRILPKPEDRTDVATTMTIGSVIVIFWNLVGIDFWGCAVGYSIMTAGLYVMEGRQVK
jgi:hypothetical protein